MHIAYYVVKAQEINIHNFMNIHTLFQLRSGFIYFI